MAKYKGMAHEGVEAVLEVFVEKLVIENVARIREHVHVLNQIGQQVADLLSRAVHYF